MKTENELKSLCEQCTEFFKSTPDTAVEARVNDYAIELWPAETNKFKDTFYLMDRVVDFCRFFKMDHYVTYCFEERKIVARLF